MLLLSPLLRSTDSKFISFKETLEHEDILWDKTLLGDHNPKALVDTMVYYIDLYFVIRGGEHRRIRHCPSQLRLCEPASHIAYLVFTEDVSKTNQGGLFTGRKLQRKLCIMQMGPIPSVV